MIKTLKSQTSKHRDSTYQYKNPPNQLKNNILNMQEQGDCNSSYLINDLTKGLKRIKQQQTNKKNLIYQRFLKDVPWFKSIAQRTINHQINPEKEQKVDFCFNCSNQMIRFYNWIIGYNDPFWNSQQENISATKIEQWIINYDLMVECLRAKILLYCQEPVNKMKIQN